MGSEEEPQRLKHMADHMIEEGLIEPMIFVMPTYVYSREELGQARATALTFYKELINDLIPAVEGQFRTYAADLTAEGIRRSRGIGLSEDFLWAVWRPGRSLPGPWIRPNII